MSEGLITSIIHCDMVKNSKRTKYIDSKPKTKNKAWLIGKTDDLVILRREISNKYSKWPSYSYLGIIIMDDCLKLVKQWGNYETIKVELGNSFIELPFAIAITSVTLNNILATDKLLDTV